MGVDLRHGGNRAVLAERLGCSPSRLLDASASLAPWTPRLRLGPLDVVRDYPDRRHQALRQVLAASHQLDPVQGAAHFEVPDEVAKTLVKQLGSQLPGYLVPRLVRERPGEPAKTPL